jgi:hypothetical protein
MMVMGMMVVVVMVVMVVVVIHRCWSLVGVWASRELGCMV